MREKNISADSFQSGAKTFILMTGSATILTHICQLIHASFSLYVSALAITLVLIFAGSAWAEIKNGNWRGSRLTWHSSAFIMTATCILGGMLAYLMNHPNIDDYYYTPNAVFFTEHPSAQMGNEIHFLFSGGQPFVSSFWGTANAYELAQAGLARLLNTHFLDVYHTLITTLNGLLIPYAIYLAIRSFKIDKTSAAVGAFITTLFILVCHEARTIGVFSFPRIFQGKAVVLSIVIPLTIAWSREFFNRRSVKNWLCLFFLFTSAAGLSISAAPILCGLCACLLIGWISENRRIAAARTIFFYLLSPIYLVACALYASTTSANVLSEGSVVNWGWPTTFIGHLALAENINAPVSLVLGVISLLVFARLNTDGRRLFIFGWIASAVVLFLNPLSAIPLIKYVTSPNAYWRLFFILPFPFILGLAVSVVFDRARMRSTRQAVLVVITLPLVAAGILVAVPASSAFQRTTLRSGLYNYKIYDWLLPVSRSIIETNPPGIMLAPPDLSGAMSMLSSKFTQLRIREDAVRLWLGGQGRGEEAEKRIAASDFLDDASANFDALKEIVGKYGEIDFVLAKSAVSAKPQVNDFLRASGFAAQSEYGIYTLWARSSEK